MFCSLKENHVIYFFKPNSKYKQDENNLEVV